MIQNFFYKIFNFSSLDIINFNEIGKILKYNNFFKRNTFRA